jgi:hypothetical protein
MLVQHTMLCRTAHATCHQHMQIMPCRTMLCRVLGTQGAQHDHGLEEPQRPG